MPIRRPRSRNGGRSSRRRTSRRNKASLNNEINAAFADPKMKARFADLGVVALPGSPANFGKLRAEETEKWGKVVKFAGLKPQ